MRAIFSFITEKYLTTYFVIKTFKAELQTNIGKFTVIHINIRNLNTNIDKLKYFLIECKSSLKKKELLHSFECKCFFSSECTKLSLFESRVVTFWMGGGGQKISSAPGAEMLGGQLPILHPMFQRLWFTLYCDIK